MKPTRVALTKVILVVLFMLARSSSSHADWPTAHGSPANTGFARVDTIPPSFPVLQNVGQVAPGANPVTGPDGTVYIGNLDGELIAFFADGKPYWKRKLTNQYGAIFASPAVGADGSVYVLSNIRIRYRDHRSGETTVVHQAFLHKFSPGGGWIFAKALPKATIYPFTDGGATTAPPNIWRSNGVEAIMVPVVYTGLGRSQVRVIALSTDGNVIGDKQVTIEVYEITGTSTSILQAIIDGIIDCIGSLGCSYNPTPALPPLPLAEAGWPQPGVAISEGYPYIWVADGIRSTVAYQFDPATGFSEIYRFSDARDRLSSPPVALSNLVAAVGTSDGLLKFERENFSIPGWGAISAAPTRLNDGRLVVIARNGKMFVVSGHSVVLQQQLNGESIASAAASCTHLFVASTNELVTFDVKTLNPVARMPWIDGGKHAPIIGPFGHVYGMTDSTLAAFPAPPKAPFQTFAPRTACDPLGVLTTSGTTGLLR